jgi:tRNA modification GTPase
MSIDTIFALSTPLGKSGVAVVRVSGPYAGTAFAALGITRIPSPRVATLATLSIDGEAIDKALAFYFPAPNSFTGEDSAEFHVHGSRAIIRRLMQALGALPSLRPAEPGEFTLRAFANGKMDLTAAEGLADLIDAETEAQRKQALRAMQGKAAEFYGELRSGVLEALALTEAYIDFPDEEIPEIVLTQTDDRVRALMGMIEGQLAGAEAAGRIREGVQVAILGPPNAGKSSLMNLLAQRDVAIVAATPGTTRDVIEVYLDIGGYAVIVADTAGIREAEDAVEREGVRRSLERASEADIRIVVLDARTAQQDAAQAAPLLDEQAILLLNKTDLVLPSPLPVIAGLTPIAFSVHRQTGMDDLMTALKEKIAAFTPAEASFVAHARHSHHLTQSLAHLAHYLASEDAGLELRCEELRRAAVEIGRITGMVSADEVLGLVFSRFCIGK